MWSGNMDSALYNSKIFDMQMSAQQAMDGLTKTSGFPSTWTQANVELIGIAQKSGIIDKTKFKNFVSMDYNLAKTKLGLDGYEFSFDLNALNVSDSNRIGLTPSASTSVVSVNRTVVYNGGEAIVTLKVFEK